MSKKAMDEEGIANELSGSAFFRKARADRKQAAGEAVAVASEDQVAATESSAQPVVHRSNERTNARTQIRHTFDLFQDQIESLYQIQLDRLRSTGRKPKMGELAQEALDAYIKAANERTNRGRDSTFPKRGVDKQG